MTGIELININKTFTGSTIKAVEDFNLSIPQGSFISLLGPSGCGKTTTLRMLTGLETPDEGIIRLGDKVLFNGETKELVPTEKRGMGLVFQSYALWPHMTIEQNISFGLEMQKVPKQEIAGRIEKIISLLRIEGLEKRYPNQLSGGQQQRIALARMMVLNPHILLLDEPLSNLDAKLRLEMRAELKRLHRELKNTVIYVTHDQMEAMTLSTEIAVMSRGKLQQYAPPMEMYKKPANLFVADFIGSPPMNHFSIKDGESLAKTIMPLFPELAEKAFTIGLRPESIMVNPHSTAARENFWKHTAQIETVLPTGSEWIIGLRIDNVSFFALLVEDCDYNPGDNVKVVIDPKNFLIFDKEGVRISR